MYIFLIFLRGLLRWTFSWCYRNQWRREFRKTFALLWGKLKFKICFRNHVVFQLFIPKLSKALKSLNSTFAFQLIIKALLPKNLGGCESTVILIDTESKFMMQRFLQVFKKFVDSKTFNNQTLIESCISNLFILKCFNLDQYELTLDRLSELISSNAKISLVVLDSIASFYWVQSDLKFDSYENYLKNYVAKFKKLCDDYLVTFVYTRPSHFNSLDIVSLPVNYSIKLDRLDEKSLAMKINKGSNNQICKIFGILQTGIHYIKSAADERDFGLLDGKLAVGWDKRSKSFSSHSF